MSEHRSGTGAKLSTYVREYMERTGVKNLALARRSIDPESGQELLPQWIKHLVENRIPRAPEPWRYRALAAGMGVDVERIKMLAADQWVGTHLTDGGDLVELGGGEWATFRALSETDRQIVRETALALARRLAAEGRNGE